jgi:predicted ATP-grasp superfamily ATP-dependent carboligase
MIGALVIGGHVQGLGLIRALGMKRIPVYLLDTTNYNISRYSKYCKKFIQMPLEVWDSSDNFIDFLRETHKIYNLDKWIIFPTDDLTVAYLSKNKHELSEYFTIWTPEWDCVKYCYDKKLTYKLAETIGIPIPKSYFPEDVSDLNEVDYLFHYPLIIKPAIMHEFYKETKHKVFVIHNKEDLKRKYLKACSATNPLDIIIQEIILGGPENLYSFGSFFKEGEAIASIIGRRSRQIPMDFGKASTFAELCEIPEIYELGIKLLKAINYYGLSEVEFKKDSRDGIYKLLEVNPRTWKWHSIALLAGINLPYCLYCDMIERKLKISNNKNRRDVKWIDLYTDLYIVIGEMLKGKMSISDYLVSLNGEKTDAVLSFEDLKPFIMETILLPYLWKER